MRIYARKLGARSFFTIRFLAADLSFPIALFGTMLLVIGSVVSFGASSYSRSIVVSPIAEVVRAEYLVGALASPISEISKRVEQRVYSGYEVSVGSVCKQFLSRDLVMAVKVLVETPGDSDLTVGDAKLEPKTCSQIITNSDKYKYIHIVLDNKVNDLDGRISYYLRTKGDSSLIPSKKSLSSMIP